MYVPWEKIGKIVVTLSAICLGLSLCLFGLYRIIRGKPAESVTEVEDGPFKILIRTQEFRHSGTVNVDICVEETSSHAFPDPWTGILQRSRAQCFFSGFDFGNLSAKWMGKRDIEVSFSSGYLSEFRNYALLQRKGSLPVAFHVSLREERAAVSEEGGNDQQKYSDSLLVASAAKNPKYLTYPDGRQQLIYTIEAPYPAEELLSFIRAELQKRSWKPLAEDFLNRGIPSSIQRGWSRFEDKTQQTDVYAWLADWENSMHDITVYSLRYESPHNSTRDLRNVEVIALFIPADIADKMKRSSEPKK